MEGVGDLHDKYTIVYSKDSIFVLWGFEHSFHVIVM